MRAMLFILGTTLMLTACGGPDGLRDLSADTDGPDEFSVLPNRPLVIPTDLSRLPPPTPGGSNPADATPRANAIAALGGNAAAVQAGGVPTSDAALVAAAGRNGVTPGIRQTLASEDAAFRGRRNTLRIFNIFGGDRYFRAYAGQALDAYAELERFRALGVATPTAPPR